MADRLSALDASFRYLEDRSAPPGPQGPLSAGTAQLTELFPTMPLMRDQALAVGVTSYDGGVYFGLTGDRDAMSDVDLLAKMVEESVDELLTAPRWL